MNNHNKPSRLFHVTIFKKNSSIIEEEFKIRADSFAQCRQGLLELNYHPAQFNILDVTLICQRGKYGK